MIGAPNIALLIDADNASPDHLDEVLLVLSELGAINIRRAYGNWKKAQLKSWEALTYEHSIVPVQQFDVVKGKSATDMRMIIDCMDLLYRGQMAGLGIMSSDSDFSPLVQRIRESGLPVYGFGTTKTPQSLKAACTRFIDVAALQASAPNEEPAEVPQGPTSDVVKVLGDAWKQSKRDDEGYALISEVGQRAANLSSFSVRNYGARSLSELFGTLEQFGVRRADDGRLLVKRLR
ncbi:NYN domain-containing protein [Sphingomonas swuensis]|uniref:NYN domain-containing protein n=1 Tax=Sphingomonas swuensis TaxID=977800 RepID=A0ABP7SUM0_9SPHN